MDTQSPEYATQDTTPASSTSDLVTPPEQSNQPAPSQYGMGAPVPQYPPSYPPLSGAPSPYNTPMPANPYAGPYAGDATQPGIAGAPPTYEQAGYGQSGYGQPAPVSMPFPGYPPAGMPAAMITPPLKAKKRRRGLWITLTIVLVLLLLGGGVGAFAYMQYRAPQDAAAQVCTLVQHQNYADLYTSFSGALRGQYTEGVFSDSANQLDQVEGKVTSCGPTTVGNAFSYTLLGNTATQMVTISRATQGSLQGTIHLVNEDGSWKVDAIDSSLLGINLRALKAANDFCAAMVSGDSNAAYALMGSSFQGTVSRSDFNTDEQVRKNIDGPLASCKVIAITPGGSDTAVTLTLGAKRAKLAEATGSAVLSVEDGSWKVTDIGDELGGTDIGPYYLTVGFCKDVQRGDWNTLYGLFSIGFRHHFSKETTISFLQVPKGEKFTGCNFNYDNYKVSAGNATVHLSVILSFTGGEAVYPLTLYCVIEGSDWKIDDFSFS